MDEVLAAKLRLIKLGIDIVVIEDELLPEDQLEESADQENRVGGVAGMDGVEAVSAEYPAGERELVEQRRRIFEHEAEPTSRLDELRMPIDADPLELDVGFLRTGALGTDDSNRIAGPLQCRCLCPSAAIERNWEVLDDDQHSWARAHVLLSRLALPVDAIVAFCKVRDTADPHQVYQQLMAGQPVGNRRRFPRFLPEHHHLTMCERLIEAAHH